MMQSNRNNFKGVFFLLKLIISVFSIWLIYCRVIEMENSGDWFKSTGHSVLKDDLILLCIVFVLMFLNWLIEAVKWKKAMKSLESVSIAKAYKAVCSGMTVSFFTPNRTGEFAGRVFHLSKADRIEASIATVLESFSQLIITIVIGSLSAAYFLRSFASLPHMLENGVIVLLLLLSLSLLFFYLNVSLLEGLYRKYRFPEKWHHYFRIFSAFSRSDLISLLLLSGLRYLVFVIQFYLLLMIFKINLPFLVSFIFTSVTYLAMATVPTFAFTEIGIRTSVAVYFYSHVTNMSQAVVNASFALWIINLVIPALAGALFIFNFKFVRSKPE